MTDSPESGTGIGPARRPLATRGRPWAQALARALTHAGVSPNSISLFSIGFALAAGVCLVAAGRAEGIARVLLYLAAAACIQVRLLCNLLDGMIAIEGGRRTSSGEIFNDMPDRFADLAILVAAGYSLEGLALGRELGWLAGTMAVLTAYVRLLGGSLGVRQYFIGPMAKPHRMAVLTVACIASTLEPAIGWHGQVLAAALIVIIVGSAITFIRRTTRIVRDLKAR